MTPQKRRRLLIDRQVQGAVIKRAAMYWIFYALSIASWIVCWQMIYNSLEITASGFGGLWMQFGPALVASLLLLPVVLIDAVRVSNRFAGPMFRLRRAMNQLADGESVEPLQVRDDDFWSDVVESFNRVAARLQDAEKGQRGQSQVSGQDDPSELEQSTLV
jgi:nitrogen fixation/metabolism regulation signal transduction histidine kinase